MMRELLQRQPGVEQPAVQPVVEQPAVQPRQEVQTPTRVQGNLGDQMPRAPREIHGVPLGVEMRNAMPMRPLNQDFRAQANQPRVGMQMGEFFENGQNGPILGDFGDPIEERRSVRNNARFMPPFQGHCDDPYEEPWKGQGSTKELTIEILIGKSKMDLHGNQGRARDLRPMKLDFLRRAETRNVIPIRAPNHEVHFNPNQPQFSMPYDDPFEPRPKRLNGGVVLNPSVESLCGLGNARPPPSFEGQCGLYGEEYWREKRFPRQQQQFHTFGQQAQPQRHASQAREPRNAPWPQGDIVEPWYDHGGGRGNKEGKQGSREQWKLEFPRFKGGDPTSWMFRAIQYFEYYQVHDASKVMHASYHLDDDALIWFQSCEHDLGCWDNFARAIQLRFGPPSYDDPIELLIKLKHVNSIEEYKGLFESLSNRIRNLSSMHKLSCFMSGLKDEVRLAIKMQGPRTLGEAYALAKIQEQYLANVKRSTRPSYEANKDNWEQYSSQEVVAQFGPKVATQSDPKVAECDPEVAAQIVPKVVAQFDPKVAAQLDPKVAVQFDPKVAAQLNPKVAAQMDPKVADPKPISAKPTMMVQKLTPKQMLERRRKGLCYYCDESWTMWHTCKAMKLYLIEEVQEEEGAYVTSDEEEERVEWCEERRNTKEESINKDIQVPSRYWLIGRSPLMKKQLEDSSSIWPQ
uniref:Ty3 transposon capsid-like protein domain-containing protein n=1 Tax=Fagus sylvatica TaxID=28930 RepID=A0A2N9I8T7_FAGSY